MFQEYVHSDYMGKLKDWLERCILGISTKDQEHNIFKDLDAICNKKKIDKKKGESNEVDADND